VSTAKETKELEVTRMNNKVLLRLLTAISNEYGVNVNWLMVSKMDKASKAIEAHATDNKHIKYTAYIQDGNVMVSIV
jgi:hypothetical protein